MRRVRPRIALVRALVAGAAVAIVVARAPAGVPLVTANGTPFAWDLDTVQPNVVGGRVTYHVDVSALRDTIFGPTSAAAAVHAGVRAWEAPTTRIRFAPDARPAPASGVNGLDRVNWIGWSRTELGRATFAATFPTRSGPRITDMDVVMNDRDFRWDTWTEGVPGDADIQGLVAHEWGHAIGAEHVPLRTSTMFFEASEGVVSLRTLAPDDVALVGSMYPNQTFRDQTGAITGRVDVAGTKDDRSAHVVAVSVASGEPAASTLTRPDGRFEIQGLPRGAYRVVVAPCHPLGSAMNGFWRSGSTTFQPAAFAASGAGRLRAQIVLVENGGSVDVGQVRVRAAAPLFEPNDTPAEAARIEVGDAVGARFETPSDQDWYVFHANAGENLTVKVLAWGLGSDADPSLRLTDDAGNTIRTVLDLRDGRFFGRIEGEDRDARIPMPGNAIVAPAPPWVVQQAGDYRIRVAQDVPARGSQAFYVLVVSVASDSPSPSLTEIAAAPARVDADGTSAATILVTPRTEAGDPITAADVSVFRNGDPAGTAIFSAADASFRLDVTAPQTSASDTFSAMVATSTGVATTTRAATVVWLGPMDPAASTLAATPRRIRADGVSTSKVRFVPRDARDETLGPGRATLVSLDLPRGAGLGATVSQPDGTYVVQVTAGTERGTSTLSASVGAQTAVATATIGFGFALPDVLATVATDIAAFRVTPRLPRASASALAVAAKHVAAGRAAVNDTAHAPASELRALSRVKSALVAVVTAIQRSKRRLADPGTTRELALATRESAGLAIDRAAAAARNARDRRRVATARALLRKGDAALGARKVTVAQAGFLAAYRAVPLSR